jgi:tetratricopeptide (TPR) repeat protein
MIPTPLSSSHAVSQRTYDVLQSIRSFPETFDFDRLAEDLVHLFWELYADRPDNGELCEWVMGHEKAILEFGRNFDLLGINNELISFLRLVARANDSSSLLFEKISELEESFTKNANQLDFDSYTACIADFVYFFFECAKADNVLPVIIDNDAVRVGRHCQISFNRTLRIPEDGKNYPLPAGFGRLPICRVEDYADKVPEKWLNEGGFFIPLYQKEALFLEFAGVKWRPCAVKVAVGRVNAVTGDNYDEKVRSHKQDYLVVPDQKWLDGINSGEGRVGQFVAMPLGKGFTVEAQVTDEEEHGGFQIVVFDPKEQRFPNEDPKEEARRKRGLERRKHDVIAGAAVYAAAVSPREGILYAGAHPLSAAAGGIEEEFEMGIAKGGNITQEIVEDTYGADSWDENNRGAIVIHIVNSLVYQEITGNQPPSTPITPEAYAKCKIPWFDAYDETAVGLSPGKPFQHLKSIGSLEKAKGIASEREHKSIAISPERLQKIKTPSKKERVRSLLDRAQNSSRLGLHAIALRESSCALDLLNGLDASQERSPSLALALQLRGEANLALGRYLDAEGDASDCLNQDYGNRSALLTRAQALLKMGEHRLAIDDAKRILRSEPEHLTGRTILVDSILLENLTQLVKNALEAEQTVLPSAPSLEMLTTQGKNDFIKALEDSSPQQDGGLTDLAHIFREILVTRRDEIRKTPPVVFRIFLLNYFPHIWAKEDLELAAGFYERKLESSRAFLKHRSIPSIEEGLQAGLHLVSDNPALLFLLRWWEMDKFSTAQKIIGELKSSGLAIHIERNIAPPNNWQEIDRRLTYFDHGNSAGQLNLLGSSSPDPGRLNLFDTLTPEQREIVKSKDVGLVKGANGTDKEAELESATLWAPASAAKAINKYLVPGQQNYGLLKLVSNSVELPQVESTHNSQASNQNLPPQPYAIAEYKLAVMYLQGQGVTQDYVLALNWFQKAADRGHADAQVNLGILYENGRGVARNYSKAIAMYEKAAEQGEADGYNGLAWVLATCPLAAFRDGRRAVEAATRACELTEWKNPNNLDTLAAAFAESGDFESAVKWQTKQLETLDLTPSQIADAKAHLALFKLHKPFRTEQVDSRSEA